MHANREKIVALGQKFTVLTCSQFTASGKGYENGNWCYNSAIHFNTLEKNPVTECAYLLTKLLPSTDH